MKSAHPDKNAYNNSVYPKQGAYPNQTLPKWEVQMYSNKKIPNSDVKMKCTVPQKKFHTPK